MVQVFEMEEGSTASLVVKHQTIDFSPGGLKLSSNEYIKEKSQPDQ